MKKTKFTEEKILFALKQGNAGQPVADVCRQMGISEATYYVWKKRYAYLGILEVRELRQLRDENARLTSILENEVHNAPFGMARSARSKWLCRSHVRIGKKERLPGINNRRYVSHQTSLD